MAEEKAKRGHGWRRVLLAWAAILLVLGLIGCVVLYRYLAVYEFTRPELLMDQLLDDWTAEAFLAEAGKNLDFPVTEFEDRENLFARYRETLALDAPLSYREEKRSSNRETAAFVVRCGPVNLCRVELKSNEEKLPFGRHGWALGQISSGNITRSLDAVTATVRALPEQELYLNGKPLTAQYRSGEEIPIEDLNDLEKQLDPLPTQVEYTVGPLYGDLSLESAEGQPVPVQSRSGGQVTYDAVSLARYTLTISAPADASVSVGGVILRQEDAALSPGILEGLSAFTGKEDVTRRLYSFPDMLTAPEITAQDSAGQELEPIRAENGECRIYDVNDLSAAEALQPYADAFFGDYVEYTSNAFSEYRYYKLLEKILLRTELYRYVDKSRDAMLWAPTTETEFSELRYDHFHRVGDRCFTCTVSYDANMSYSTWSSDRHDYTQRSAYELAFVWDGKTWLAAAMTSIA